MNHARSLRVTARGEREIEITRTFDAPRELVFEAMFRAELLKRWLLGPPGWEMTACESDPRPGGTFRHEWSGPDGAAMSMHGVYREIEAPARIVRTETFDTGCEDQAGEQLATMTLEEEGEGTTRVRISVRYPSKEARDGALASGMEQGMEACYARLDAELEGLRA